MNQDISTNKKSTKNIHPLKWVPSAYFAMGLPFVILNMVCVLMFKGMGIDDGRIAFWTSIIMFPWTLKFLWSPLLELVKYKKTIVVITQILCGTGLGLVALALQLPVFFAVCIALLTVVALSGATHDVALDGLYMAELSESDQAKYIGWQGAFYNLAKLVATGLLVYIAGVLIDSFSNGITNDAAITLEANRSAWSIIMVICGILLGGLGIWHLFSLPKGESQVKPNTSVKNELKTVISTFFTKKHIWLYISFIILYRLGEGFVMKIVPLFLKADIAQGGLGLTEQQIGLYYGTFGAAAFVIGSLLAGYYISHRGLKKALFSLVCIFNLPFLIYAFLAWFQPDNMAVIAAGITVEYFGYGFGFVGLTLFMMQQVAPGEHQMAHYAFASAIMNLSVMVTGAVSGYLSDYLGYKIFFIVVMLATIPIFILSKTIPFTYAEEKKQA